MSTKNTIVEHDRSMLFTQLWLLAKKDAAGNWEYRKGLTDEERQDITNALTDTLDVERRNIIGDRFTLVRDTTETHPPVGDVKPPVNTAPLLDIHDPAHYSFGGKKKWVPFAKELKSGAKRGKYAKGYPRGAIVHWTAGHRSSLEDANGIMRATGMLYLLIDHKGELGQSDPLTDHGYHAGASAHKALSGYVSDDLVGIEVMAAGTLTKSGEFYYPWWDKNQKTGKHQFLTANRIPASEVVTSGRVANIAPGHYHKYTEAQTLALRKTLCWLHLNDPTVFSLDLILGHDEVSPTRKTDPGAALVVNGSPVSMQAFRDIVKADVAAILARKASA